jgi:hypothetical protein
VSGVARYALGLLDFFEVAASGGAVGPQVVGGDASEEGGVFGVVVEDLGLEVDAEAVGGAGDGDGPAFAAGGGGEVMGELSGLRSGKVASCFLLPTM